MHVRKRGMVGGGDGWIVVHDGPDGGLLFKCFG